ncbi:hypothetical protein EDD18DRAFT_1361925 [Armillaria luteobubalina]|uniref:Uncharacterized protein n=1 Tax=Armillaria luteobubalina TaxID=153913 RepID=A0AA39UIH2_9AGAR|nr:hypothetical protein EDD18DRAFT_1361925 [Armillaria luteobubalina]
MKNIVPTLVIECATDEFDAVRKPCNMSLDDAVHELRDEAVWFDGFDWLDSRTKWLGFDSSLSSRSEGSTTSPVLSTSTLQTTPSPPPKQAIWIPLSPILDPSTAVEADTVYAGIVYPYAGAEFGDFPSNMERRLSAAIPLPSPDVADLPVRKRSLADVAEPVRSATPPNTLKVDVEVDAPELRLKKRNSEELEVVEDGAGRKRFKTEEIVESPLMSLDNSDHSSSVPPLGEEETR